MERTETLQKRIGPQTELGKRMVHGGDALTDACNLETGLTHGNLRKTILAECFLAAGILGYAFTRTDDLYQMTVKVYECSTPVDGHLSDTERLLSRIIKKTVSSLPFSSPSALLDTNYEIPGGTMRKIVEPCCTRYDLFKIDIIEFLKFTIDGISGAKDVDVLKRLELTPEQISIIQSGYNQLVARKQLIQDTRFFGTLSSVVVGLLGTISYFSNPEINSKKVQVSSTGVWLGGKIRQLGELL